MFLSRFSIRSPTIVAVVVMVAGAACQSKSASVECTSKPVTAIGTSFFTDISDASGIRLDNYTPNPPKPIPINDHSRLAFADLDGDGWDDIVMHNLFPDPQGGIPFEHLVFLNNHDGTFRDFSDASGLRNVQAGFFVFGDVDNDGDEDCFAGLDIPLAGLGNAVYLNDGQGHFTLTPNAGFDSPASGLDGIGNTDTANALFADFNNDGKLDLFLGNGQTSYADHNQLFFGNGDGTFSDVTNSNLMGTVPAQPTNGLVACDYDNDGDLDIFVSTYGVSEALGHKQLWENDGTGNFTNVAEARGFAALPTGNYWLASTGNGTTAEPGATTATYVGSNGFGIDCQDLNGDGLPDIYLATISHPDGAGSTPGEPYERTWSDPSQLLINQGESGGFSFVNEFLKRNLPFNEGDIDAAMMDFDNDGLIDLSVTRDNKYESAYTGADQKAWLGLFHQLADGTYQSVGLDSGINDPMDTTSALPRMKAGQNHAWSDIDHDGDLDLLVGGRDHGGGRANFLFRNEIGSQNTWLAVRLSGDGKDINRDALGARVTITGNGQTFMRESKSSRGTYDSIDTRTLHFGLGDMGCAFTLTVRWPNGKTTVVDGSRIPLNSYIGIDYVAGFSVLTDGMKG